MSLPVSKGNRILFVGSNPSVRSSTNEAFSVDTKSGRTLREWTKFLDGEILYENVSSVKTSSNRPLNKQEWEEAIERMDKLINTLKPDHIVTLDTTADKVLNNIPYGHFAMWHPSGMNRLNNNSASLEIMLKELRCYCRHEEKYQSMVKFFYNILPALKLTSMRPSLEHNQKIYNYFKF